MAKEPYELAIPVPLLGDLTVRVVLVSVDLLASSQFEGAARSVGAEVANIGPAKLDQAVESPPELVVFDLSTPTQDLPGKVARLKALDPPPAVIAFGPHVQEQKLQAAADAGCDAVLTRGQFYRSAAEILQRYASS